MPAAPQMTTADLSEESATVALLRAAIGPVNTKSYLAVFTQFDMLERSGVSWNWAAGLCTLNWMAYRQLWSAALAYAGAVVGAILLIFGIGRLVFQFSEGVELGLLLAFAMAAIAIPGLYGNALLYAATRKKMAAALANAPTVPEACALLARRAPSRLRLLLLALVNVAVIGAAVAGYVEFPHMGRLASSPVKAVEPTTEPKPAIPATPAIPPSTPIAAEASVLPAAPTSPAAPTVAPAVAPAASGESTAPTVQASPAVPEKPAAVSVAPVAAPVAATNPAPAAPTPMAAPAPIPAEPAKVAKPKAKQDKPAAPAKATPESRYYVNVGLFADANNALNTFVKLTDAGLAATKQEFNTSKGKRTRVRLGPFDTEGQAISAIEKVRALGLEAIIVRPEKP